jgi:hypothetical protein
MKRNAINTSRKSDIFSTFAANGRIVIVIRHQTIKKSIAFLLLVVFAISAAPKAYFHDLFADHKDGSTCQLRHNTAVLHHQGFNCHFDDLVVSSFFLSNSDQIIPAANDFFAKKFNCFYSPVFQSFIQHKENRGPPSA